MAAYDTHPFFIANPNGNAITTQSFASTALRPGKEVMQLSIKGTISAGSVILAVKTPGMDTFMPVTDGTFTAVPVDKSIDCVGAHVDYRIQTSADFSGSIWFYLGV